MNVKPEYLTREKHRELASELEQLKTVRRKEVAENLEYAKSLGDLAENAEYQEAREAQANIEDRIQRLEAMLASAVIMEPRHADTAEIGSTVHLLKEGDDGGIVFRIVGSEEADLAHGKISTNSPIGGAILGRRKGERFVVKAPGGLVAYTITEIE